MPRPRGLGGRGCPRPETTYGTILESAEYGLTLGKRPAMTDPPLKRDPVEVLAGEFAARCRRGELPSISEYTAEYPKHAGQIQDLFPAVVLLERLRAEEMARREAAGRRAASRSPPKGIGDRGTGRD
jgi:hypothetical protein